MPKWKWMYASKRQFYPLRRPLFDSSTLLTGIYAVEDRTPLYKRKHISCIQGTVNDCYFVLASLVPVLSSFELIDITQGVLFLHTTSILHVMFILNARKYSLNLSKTIKKFGFVEWWIAYLLLIDSEIKQAIYFCYICGFFGQ